MPFPFAETVALTDLQRAQLESLVRAGSTPQALVFRCRLILRAADRDHPTNLQIAAEFDCNRHTVAGWRNRYLSNGLAGLQDASRSGRPRRFSPSERLDLINLASSTTEQQGCPATRWSLDDLAATLINRNAHDLAMSRSTIWRILDEADLKPHRSVYWLNSHDPDFDAKAQEICKLYIKAPMMYQQGRLVICCDEKTGMQALGRPHPTQPAVPGKPERREQDYIRYGTRALIASFIVPTGELIGDLGPTRTSVDFATHLNHVAGRFPQIKDFDWVLDNLNTHWSLEVCRVIAQLCDVAFEAAVLQTGKQRRAFLTDPTHKHVFHFTPTHGSWLNQVELWFSVFGRRFLKRGDFASMADFEARLLSKRLRGVKPCFRFKVGGPATTNRLRGATQASRGRGLFPVAPRHHVVDRAGKLDLRGSSHAHSSARVFPTANRKQGLSPLSLRKAPSDHAKRPVNRKQGLTPRSVC